ncbi:MAG TPA: hypothetical protein VHT29_08225 [Solirubrobacteraceae bacterium]|nr:hypothetical protein [Solirubrobacteraceae bacterium]
MARRVEAKERPGAGRGRLTAGLVVASMALGLMLAPSALAGLQKEYSVFSDCPVNTPGVVGCVVSYTTGGEFHLGSKTVPINKTITLQGGTSSTSPDLVPAADGNTLSKTPLTLPGGLIGVELLPPLTEVTATAELAGPVVLNVGNLFAGKGTAVALPIKAKLDNPSLGSTCYIGSEATPIAPQLTAGTTSPPGPNTPITGNEGTLEFAGDGNIVIVKGASLVDNAFAVPGASGCDGLLSLIVDPSVDLVAGVPAEAGHNTAILDSTFENVSSDLVKAQREIPEFGRCVKVEGVREGKTKVYDGSYNDSGCLSPSKGGEYEWTTGPGANPTFTAGAGKTTLEAVGGASTLSCSHALAAGSITGAKTATATVTLTGCKLASNKASCQSAGAAGGEIVTSVLQGSLGFVEDAVEGGQLNVSVGLDLTHSPSLLTAECAGGASVTVAGSVIAPFTTIDKTTASNTLIFSATGGKQTPEAFEEGAKDTLTTAVSGGAPVQSGLSSRAKVKSAEPIEVKAEAR